MSTNSFTRKIRITDPSVIKKIKNAMRKHSIDQYKTSIYNINELQTEARKSLAAKLTQKF